MPRHLRRRRSNIIETLRYDSDGKRMICGGFKVLIDA
jgi:uncharacterized protein YbaA (DUF1428 family)